MLFGKEEDALARDARLFPIGRGFLVAGAVLVAREHRRGQFLGVDAEVFVARQELVAPCDLLFLEIVAQRPVAQHLEEREVRGVAHLVDVARADALLNVGKTRALGVLLTEKVGHEGVHARRREQNGGIVLGDEGRGADERVSLALVEIEPHLAQLRSIDLFHDYSVYV